MSPIDVERTTIGFPFPAAAATPPRPSARVTMPSARTMRSPPRFVDRAVFSTPPAAPQPASVRAVRRGHRQPDRRHGAREIAADLDAAAIVDARHEPAPRDARVRDHVALAVEREDRRERLMHVGLAG